MTAFRRLHVSLPKVANSHKAPHGIGRSSPQKPIRSVKHPCISNKVASSKLYLESFLDLPLPNSSLFLLTFNELVEVPGLEPGDAFRTKI